ncbi:MAG: FAD:protein FMN transferase, partial [Clostridia bacterium]|nr:FAD:protein FMN transferase [Clostridia bacterium]
MRSLSKKSVIIIITAAAIALLIVAASIIDAVLQKRNTPFTHTGIAMGSAVTQTLYGDDVCADVSQAIASLDNEKISTTSLFSEISEINRNAGKTAVEVSDETLNYIKICIDIADKTGGAFNPLMGALIDLWSIESANPSVPSADDIEAALSL